MWQWLALLCGVCAGPLRPLPAIELEIVDTNFVQLQVGIPPRYHMFYLSPRVSYIAFHSPAIIKQSHSFEELAPPHGSELLYFPAASKAPLRFPVRIAAPLPHQELHLTSATVADGTLGIGPQSPLWLHWRNFTLTAGNLLLGQYNRFLQKAPRGLPLALSNGTGLCQLDDDTVGPPLQCSLDFSTVDSLVPHQFLVGGIPPSYVHIHSPASCAVLYSALAQPQPHCSSDAGFAFGQHRMELLSGFTYEAIRPSPDASLYMGKRFMQDCVVFVDWFASVFLLSDSAVNFSTNRATPYFTMIILTALIIWLILSVHSRRYDSHNPVRRMLLSYAELVTYVAVLCCWSVCYIGFQWSRFVSTFLRTEPHFWLAYLHILVLGCALPGTVLALVYSLPREDRRPRFPLRIFLLANASAYMLWSCFLPHHRHSADQLFLLFFATAPPILNSVLVLHLLLRGRQYWLQAAFTGVAALAGFQFLFWANLVPIASAWTYSLAQVVAGYFAIGCAFPICYFFARFETVFLWNEFEEHRHSEETPAHRKQREKERGEDFYHNAVNIAD